MSRRQPAATDKMAWIKRHLLLAVGGLVALALLGAGTWDLLSNMTRNEEVAKELDSQKQALEQLFAKDPFPNRTNIDAARREIARIRAVINQARQSFSPVPYENVTGLAFKTLLDNTLADLHKKAEKSSVGLPGKSYEFSFAAQKKALNFAPAIFPKINIQLAEIKTICNIFFDSKINQLKSVRRVRVAADDPQGLPDYLDSHTDVTNDITGAVLSPYQFEFWCFSSELAAAIEGLYRSPHGLLLKAMHVEPAPQPLGGAGAAAAPPPGPVVPPAGPVARPVPPGARRPPGLPPPKEGLEVVLNEKLLKVTVLIEVVKPGTTK